MKGFSGFNELPGVRDVQIALNFIQICWAAHQRVSDGSSCINIAHHVHGPMIVQLDSERVRVTCDVIQYHIDLSCFPIKIFVLATPKALLQGEKAEPGILQPVGFGNDFLLQMTGAIRRSIEQTCNCEGS